MLATQTPLLRRFWYPLMPLAMLRDGPKPFTLLGEKLDAVTVGFGLAVIATVFIGKKLPVGASKQGNK